jgi:hypothetical protein
LEKLMKFTEMPSCSFSDELLSYLYEEISPAQSRSFESHLESCETCRSEFSEFTSVRDAVGLWRDNILAMAPALRVTDAVPGPSVPMESASKRSAVAAFREFFSLSPLWLRGATAFAAFAMFGLLVFSIWRVSNPDRGTVLEVAKSIPSPTGENQATRVKQDVPLQSVSRTVKPDSGRENSSATQFIGNIPNEHSAGVRHSSPRGQRPRQQYNANEYAVLNKAKNRQLLSDLGLVSSREEDTAPRLSDLIVDPESND